MGNARILLHVLVTFAVAFHGAWMAAMPIAHAAPVIEYGAVKAVVDTAHSVHAARDSHHAGHHSIHHGSHHSGFHSDHSSAHHDAHLESDDIHAEHTGGHQDHDMSGCECTLCKIAGVFAGDIELYLVALTYLDERPRVHPAAQVRVTTGPPVGLRAPPYSI